VSLRIALFGQAAFGKDVLARLQDAGHEIVGVYGPPEGPRPDPLCEEAEKRGLRLLRHRRFRRGGEAIPELVEEWRELRAELNLLAFVTVILPEAIVGAPPRGSLCFHPSLLPRYRGGSAIAWQIIEGEREAGVTVFVPDAGIDTGPIVVQKGGIPIEPTDTAGTLYFRKLYPAGLEAVLEAVDQVDRGTARPRAQDESQASFQGLVDDEVARIDWGRPAEVLDRLARGCDPQPGAHAGRGAARVRLFDVALLHETGPEPPGRVLRVDSEGLVVAARGGRLRVGRVRVGGRSKVAPAASPIAPGETLT
jgi:methionyl-tRNA formyltransferase